MRDAIDIVAALIAALVIFLGAVAYLVWLVSSVDGPGGGQ